MFNKIILYVNSIMMFRSFITCFYFFIFICLSVFTNSYSQIIRHQHFDVSRKDFFITLPDNTKLDCTSFIPVNISGDKIKYPCIIYCHGLGESKDETLISAEAYASYGFYTFSYSMRGQGKSSSYSDLISKNEMEDLFEIVNILKKDSLINPERIAVIGSSQGGIIPFMSAANGLDVRCIISGLVSPSFASDWIANDCVKMSLIWSLNYDEKIIRYKPYIKNFRNWILSGKNDKFDSLKKYFPVNRDFENQLFGFQVPIFLTNSWEDKFFSANGNIDFSDKINENSAMLFGFIPGHGSHVNLSDLEWAKEKYDEFLYHWLFDSPYTNNFYKYFFSISEFSESDNFRSYQYYSNTFPFDSAMKLKFFFNPESKIEEFTDSLYRGKNDFVVLKNKIKDTTLSLIECINEEFTGIRFESKFTKETITFFSNYLDYNYNIFGSPKIMLYYKSDSKVFQINFQIYETNGDNRDYFVSSVNQTIRNNTPNKLSKIAISGNAMSHKFRQGNRIKIVITNLDTRKGDIFLRTNPYVLPILSKSECKIYTNQTNPSYIELPILELEEK